MEEQYFSPSSATDPPMDAAGLEEVMQQLDNEKGIPVMSEEQAVATFLMQEMSPAIIRRIHQEGRKFEHQYLGPYLN